MNFPPCRQLSEDVCLGKVNVTYDDHVIDAVGHSFPLAVDRGPISDVGRGTLGHSRGRYYYGALTRVKHL